eukprot:6193090-Pleurochrysis_carterae.AAC.2
MSSLKRRNDLEAIELPENSRSRRQHVCAHPAPICYAQTLVFLANSPWRYCTACRSISRGNNTANVTYGNDIWAKSEKKLKLETELMWMLPFKMSLAPRLIALTVNLIL